jgi:4-diphosphocytidyl-2-C-methyl-D-erythritol kinase
VSGGLLVAAPAKLNLFLHVGDKRADGHHDLESLVAFTLCGDEIHFEPDESISLSLSGPFGAQLSADEDNLALRAAMLLAEKTGIRRGARVHLCKILPVASGLGGGSADAAAVLRGLVRLWEIDFDREGLGEVGASLGADVPVCIDSTTAWMEGKGERVCALPPLPKARVLLVNPGVPVPTAQVFTTLRERRGVGATPPQGAFTDVYALAHFLRERTNDLEAPARAIAPIIGEVLQEIEKLPDVLLARMSGSGATCFGLFSDEEQVRGAGVVLRSRHPQWWIAETVFRAGDTVLATGTGLPVPSRNQ